MCLLSVLRDLWRSRSFDIGGTQWLAREQRTVNTVLTTSITTKSIILFIVNRCCCCCCWHLWCCLVLMTVGHALPNLVQVCHRTVKKAWTLLWHPTHAVDDAWTCSANMPRSSRIGVANCLEECCFCGVVVAPEPFCLFFLVGLGD